MKKEVFEKRFPERDESNIRFSVQSSGDMDSLCCMEDSAASGSMGLGAGGRMEQEIYDDPFKFSDWDTEHGSRAFVHIANSLVWGQITGESPPTPPPTSKEYNEYGLPWFEYYDDSAKVLDGSKTPKGLKSVAQLGKEKGEVPLPENQSVTPEMIIEYRKGMKKNQVREWR